ncbi:helix-turn-helix domain-containing protein [Streptomyces decoyicus]
MSDVDTPPRKIRCKHCDGLFFRRHGAGRAPQYCSSKCRSAAHRARNLPPTAAPAENYDHEVEVIGQSVASRARMLAHASALPVPTLPLEPIRLYVALQRDLEDYIAIAVRQALARGAEWDEISALTATSTSLLKSRFSQPQVSKMRSRRRKRRPTRPRPSAAASASWHAGEAPVYVDAELPSWQWARDALARALSYLHRSSGLPVRTLGFRSGVSASYVYRVMAGERNPAWETVQGLARACDCDPGDLLDLWNAAQGFTADGSGTPPTYAQALARFQGAFRGLHLATARSPLETFSDALETASRMELRLIESLLGPTTATGAEQLSWPTVAALTKALRGDRERMRNLWQPLRSTAPDPVTPTIPAAAFG